jgi:hypothetical protein
MAAEYLSVFFKVALAILKFIPHTAKTLWNYWKRPKFRLSVTNTNIEFITNEGKRQLPSFLSIRIHNESSTDVTIELNNFSINGESLSYIMQQNKYFSMLSVQNKSENRLTTKNELLNTFKQNWASSKFLKLVAHEHLDIPLYPRNMGDSMYFKVLNEAKVFLPKRKIVIVLTGNSQESHFAVNRMEFLKILLNGLVPDRSI